jgi:DNA-binding NtrC family response regulator
MTMPTVLIGPLEGPDPEDLAQYLRGEGYDVHTVRNMRKLFTRTHEAAIDVVIAETGIGHRRLACVVEALETHNPGTLLIAVTDRIRDSVARSDILSRVFDVVDKPIRAPEMLLRVRKALEMKRLRNEAASLRGERKIIYRADDLVAESAEMKAVLQLAERVAASDSSVRLTGETGTGKEMIAAVLHYNSARAEEAFVKVNCAALPETLLDTELFGHERGAFTGEEFERIGRFEQADGGTLLLDEVGELSGGTQAKLLRVLQERTFERVGGTKTLSVDVRIISSTNRNLSADVGARTFREDLYYRLNVVNIHVPPSRDRRDDILPLARQLLSRHEWELHQHDLGITDRRTSDDVNSVRAWNAGLSDGLHDVERETILSALEPTNWVQKDAARLLHISRRALNYRIRKLGIRHSRWRRNR